MDRFVRVVEDIAAIFMLAVALFVGLTVIARKFFGWTPPDYFDFARLALGIALFWGIASACYRNRHILVDILYEMSSALNRRRLDLIATAGVALFMAALAVMTFDAVLGAKSGNVLTAELRWPLWIFYAVCWAGSVAAFVLTLIRFVQLLGGRDTADTTTAADDIVPTAAE